jgi:hypothetical protein
MLIGRDVFVLESERQLRSTVPLGEDRARSKKTPQRRLDEERPAASFDKRPAISLRFKTQ